MFVAALSDFRRRPQILATCELLEPWNFAVIPALNLPSYSSYLFIVIVVMEGRLRIMAMVLSWWWGCWWRWSSGGDKFKFWTLMDLEDMWRLTTHDDLTSNTHCCRWACDWWSPTRRSGAAPSYSNTIGIGPGPGISRLWYALVLVGSQA